MEISAVVEGIIDEAVIRRLVVHLGGELGTVYGKSGKAKVLQRLKGYNQAAYRSPWLILIDLDQDADCAPPLKNRLLPFPAPNLCFRIAVREVESWLLADRQHLAGFLRVETSMLPRSPETISDPKNFIVQVAARSRNRAIREDLIPKPGSGRRVGPAYSSRLIEFIEATESGWTGV